MGMDGLSIANTGAIKEQTSAEYANKVEQAIASDPTNSSQVQGLAANQRVRQKDEEENANGGKQNKNLQQEFQDGLVEEENAPEEEVNFDIEEFENPNNEFYVKLNVNDDIIELYDSSSNRLIETITGSELGDLVNKLNMASGIFVNKKV